MATTIVKLQVFPECNLNKHKLRNGFGSSNSSSGVFGFGQNFGGLCLKKCRAFKSEDGGDVKEKKLRNLKKNEVKVQRENGFWSNFRNVLLGNFMMGSKLDDEYRQAVVRVDEVLSKIAVQIGRYIVTMMSTGVILAIGFQMSGGDSQMDALIWYSWLGGVIIGTMIGANWVLEDYCREGPRNVVITGSTRGLGKALAREFLLSGDRVIVTSRRWYHKL